LRTGSSLRRNSGFKRVWILRTRVLHCLLSLRLLQNHQRGGHSDVRTVKDDGKKERFQYAYKVLRVATFAAIASVAVKL
jgi:hypothetical protein